MMFKIRYLWNEFLNLFRKIKLTLVQFDVPDEIYARLKRDAKNQGISIEKLINNILKEQIKNIKYDTN